MKRPFRKPRDVEAAMGFENIEREVGVRQSAKEMNSASRKTEWLRQISLASGVQL